MIELMVAIFILAVVIVGLLQLFIQTSVLAEMSRNKTFAISAAQSKIEEIRNHTYSSIATDYAFGGTPGNTFTPTGLTGKGVIYIDSSNAALLQVDVVVCWRSKYNRIVGEDLDLDGVLDPGEDTDGDNRIDSPAVVSSLIAQR